MSPTLTGTCFAFDAPAAWTAEANEITVTSNPRRPFWELLLEASTRLIQEGSGS